MNAVAMVLLKEGVPVTSIRASGLSLSRESETDFDGDLRFTRALDNRLADNAEDITLHWSGTSGWCLLVLHDDDHDHYRHARWLGAGLLPAPERVAAFMSTLQLFPGEAGSDERPFYRPFGEGVHELHQRLAVFLPPPGDWRSRRSFQQSFRDGRAHAYATRVSAALTSQNGTEVELRLRVGELEALRYMLEHLEGSDNLLLSTFTSHLADDLLTRRDAAAAPAHRAIEIALSIQQQLRERREREKDL
ncbi:DUF6292 family protein [Streptomyces sp. NPDC088847]|uniref:DUF6292 family protein n=1 Tax=Streptomyces sp. NPDC088847 TaxID=3365909 RepID=UPI003800C84D